MNKLPYFIVTLSIIVGMVIIFSSGSRNELDTIEPGQNIEIRDGVQYITVNAKGGYFPRVSMAKSDIPTKLIVKTDRTYDCSAALMVRSVGFQKILSQTGEEVIDLGIPKAGEPIQGICSMGMYSFMINFSQ